MIAALILCPLFFAALAARSESFDPPTCPLLDPDEARRTMHAPDPGPPAAAFHPRPAPGWRGWFDRLWMRWSGQAGKEGRR